MMVENTGKSFTMRESKIFFCDGWFIYSDEKGNVSVISHQCARAMESGYQNYQAWMAIDKGGASYDTAYLSHGFTNENGTYVYRDYKVDQLIKGTVLPIEGVLTLPKKVGDIRINAIADRAFYHETAIEKVIMNKNIMVIGNSAFEGCVNLKEAVIPGDHVVIKQNAFKDTALNNQ